MSNRLRAVALILSTVVVCFPTGGVAQAQEPDPILTWQSLVNEARLNEGLAPYGFSALLSAAAQRHADDIAAHGFADPADAHLGSDQTREQQRIAEAGYAAWSWDGGELIVDENVWSGHGTIEDALALFLDDPGHRENILSTVYREIGVGAATDIHGSNYYVLDFGARPNVLPISINEGAATTHNPEIAIRLTNEEAYPEGNGASFMGQAIEIRISNEPRFDDLPWQPWAPLVPFTLPYTAGQYAIYVQFRDAASRTAASADTIVLAQRTPGAPTPADLSPTPAIAASTSSATAPTPEPTTALTPSVASTPEPPPALVPSSTLSVPIPSPSAPSATPFPTWTPLPCPEPAQGASTWTSGSGDHTALLGVLAGLQGLVLILGLYLTLRRGPHQENADRSRQ